MNRRAIVTGMLLMMVLGIGCVKQFDVSGSAMVSTAPITVDSREILTP